MVIAKQLNLRQGRFRSGLIGMQLINKLTQVSIQTVKCFCA